MTVGSSGSHSVCVCTIHQNVKLMLAAVHRSLSYRDMIAMCVCDINSKDCMLHHCDNCPGTSDLRAFIGERLAESHSVTDTIQYRQWERTDRTSIESKELEFHDFIDELVESLRSLSSHHFIAQHQSQYCRDLKNSLRRDQCLIILDFAENYSFVVQDAVQGFHWNNAQATVHPFVVYHLNDDEVLTSLSIACISDHMDHDAVSVYGFLKVVLTHLRQKLPIIRQVFFFSDGCSGQYKNFKNLTNLSFHKVDFGFSAEWHFFATSHGKNACDGVGGTIKRAAAHASLQRPLSNQILTPKQLYDFASQELKGILCFYVSSNDIEMNRSMLESRFTKRKTIPGTRSHHAFIPSNDGKIKMSRISGEIDLLAEPLAVANFNVDIESIPPGAYLACIYDSKWYIGMVLDLSVENKDIQVKFMHQRGPATTFFWPQKEDICWVPTAHILCLLVPPTSNSTGRQYQFTTEEIKDIVTRFETLLHK